MKRQSLWGPLAGGLVILGIVIGLGVISGRNEAMHETAAPTVAPVSDTEKLLQEMQAERNLNGEMAARQAALQERKGKLEAVAVRMKAAMDANDLPAYQSAVRDARALGVVIP